MEEVKLIDTKIDLTPEQLSTLSAKILEDFEDGITLQNLTKVIIDSMTIVGQFSKMEGTSKKQLVIDMIIFVLKNTDSGPFEVFEPYIINMVPSTIDALIYVEKGKLRFNPKIKNITSCFSCN